MSDTMDMETNGKGAEIPKDNAALPVGPFIFTVARLRQMEQRAAATDFSPNATSAQASKAQRRQAAAAMSQRTSKYKGVNLHSRSCRWDAHFWDKRQVHLGCFDFEIQAAVAYDMAALKVKGPEAQLNFHVSNYTEEMQQLQPMTFPEVVASLRSSRRHLLTNLRLKTPSAALAYVPAPATRSNLPAEGTASGSNHSADAATETTTSLLHHKAGPAYKRSRADSHLSHETRHRAPAHQALDAAIAYPLAAPHQSPSAYPGITLIPAGHLPPGYHIAAGPAHAPHASHHKAPSAAPAPHAPPNTGPVYICYTPSGFGGAQGPVLVEYPGSAHPHAAPHGAPYYTTAPVQYLTADTHAPTSRAITLPTSHLVQHQALPHAYPLPSSTSLRIATRRPPPPRHSDTSPSASPQGSPPHRRFRPAATRSPSSSPSQASPPRPTSPSAASDDAAPPGDPNQDPNQNSIYSASESLLLQAGRIRAKRLRDRETPPGPHPPSAAGPANPPSHPSNAPLAVYPAPAAPGPHHYHPPGTHFVAINTGNGHFILAPSHDGARPAGPHAPTAALLPPTWDDRAPAPYPSAGAVTMPAAYSPAAMLPTIVDTRRDPRGSSLPLGRPQVILYDPHMHPPHPQLPRASYASNDHRQPQMGRPLT